MSSMKEVMDAARAEVQRRADAKEEARAELRGKVDRVRQSLGAEPAREALSPIRKVAQDTFKHVRTLLASPPSTSPRKSPRASSPAMASGSSSRNPCRTLVLLILFPMGCWLFWAIVIEPLLDVDDGSARVPGGAPRRVPRRVPRRAAGASELVQSFERPASELVQSFERPASELVQSFERPGSELVQSFERPASELVQSFERPGSELVHSFERPGSGMVQSFERPGSELPVAMRGPLPAPRPTSGPMPAPRTSWTMPSWLHRSKSSQSPARKQAKTWRALVPPLEQIVGPEVAAAYRQYLASLTEYDLEDPCATVNALLPAKFRPAPPGQLPDYFSLDLNQYALCAAPHAAHPDQDHYRMMSFHTSYNCKEMDEVLQWVRSTPEYAAQGGRNFVFCTHRLPAELFTAQMDPILLTPEPRTLQHQTFRFVLTGYISHLDDVYTAPAPRPNLVTFFGGSKVNCHYKECRRRVHNAPVDMAKDYNKYTHAARDVALGFIGDHVQYHRGEIGRTETHAEAETYFRNLYRQSVFCIVPPGDVMSTKRLYDVLVAGCIPVVLVPPMAWLQQATYAPSGNREKGCTGSCTAGWNFLYPFPFEDCVPWKDISVQYGIDVEANKQVNIQKLQGYLRGLPPSTVAALQGNIQRHVSLVSYPWVAPGRQPPDLAQASALDCLAAAVLKVPPQRLQDPSQDLTGLHQDG